MAKAAGFALVAVLIASWTTAASATSHEKLVALVREDCGSCHGLTLKGSLGPSLLPDVLAGKSADALSATILDGVPGTPMPPWRGELSSQDAYWIAQKLKEGFPQ